MTAHERVRVPYDPERLAALCREFGVRQLLVFGSVLRDDFSAHSDVDLLVEFEPQVSLGFRILDFEAGLSSVFGGRRVDLVRAAYLSPRLRPHVLPEAETLYAA